MDITVEYRNQTLTLRHRSGNEVVEEVQHGFGFVGPFRMQDKESNEIVCPSRIAAGRSYVVHLGAEDKGSQTVD